MQGIRDMKIRRATAADAEALAEFGARTFYESFARDNTAEDMARHLASAWRPDLQRAEIADPLYATLLAVDADESAVEAGRAAARQAGIRNLRFLAARAEDWLTGARSPQGATAAHDATDVLLVDPPRSGLASASAAAASLGASRVVYVSCNPTTLARDLRVFLGAGYRIGSVAPIDLFPQTFHVETVCSLELT